MSNPHSCQFCSNKTTLGYIKNYFPDQKVQIKDIITHTLYHKYSASQNYYYTKEINEIICKQRTQSLIKFQDSIIYDEEDEFLKRYYQLHEYAGKIQLLTEFYKYHKDLPRWIISKHILRILNYYYDKKRKIEFFKIQRQIELENQQNPQHPPKGIVGDHPVESETTPQSDSSEPSQQVNVDNILKEISFSNKKPTELSRISQCRERQSSEIQLMISLLSISPQESPQKPQKFIKDEQYQVFKKKKKMYKRSLRLDDLALSLSSRTHQNPQEAKMPLSARYSSYSYKLIDHLNSKLGQKKHSETTSRERLQDIYINKENFVYKQIQNRKRFKLEEKYRRPTSSKKTSELKKSIPEIKQLEMKILKSLQEIEKHKSKISIDQKALHHILSKAVSQHTPRVQNPKAMDSFKQFNSNTPKLHTHFKLQLHQKSTENISNLFKKTLPNKSNSQSNNSLPSKQQVKALDLKKLMMGKLEKSAKTDRLKRNVPALNLNMIGAGNQTSFTSRNNSFNPFHSYAQLLTPKPNTTRQKQNNNLIHWQVKAIQAAQREYTTNFHK